MNMQDITQLIGTVGFPIVACAALFWENHKSEERHTQESLSRDEAINNNTKAITELTLWLRTTLSNDQKSE